ncbi:hypothetical protein [Novosphingobium sp. BL-52-GroH]|uniref:hypothetical protein n=1 Tax=Novosphingobium sp. BL-52-GroH TaxID=3349877 RepID=UPI003850AE61
MTDTHDCHVCGMAAGHGAELVHRGKDWTIVALGNVPGVFMLMTNMHDGGLATISDSAAATLGPFIRDISQAIVQDDAFDFVATAHLGDNARHTHLMFVGRPEGDAKLLDTAPLPGRMAGPADPERKARIIDQARGVAIQTGI